MPEMPLSLWTTLVSDPRRMLELLQPVGSERDDWEDDEWDYADDGWDPETQERIR